MKPVFLFMFFFSLFFVAQSAIFVERQSSLPGHEGQCYNTEDKTFYEGGEEMKWTGNECARKLCLGSYRKGFSLVETHTCGKMSYPSECLVKVNPKLPYPQCCGWVVCPKLNKSNFGVTLSGVFK